MRVRLFTMEALRPHVNGNSLRKGDWALVSYANDVFEVPDDAGNAEITRRMQKYVRPNSRYLLFVREDSPLDGHELIAPTPQSRRTRALKMWCLGHVELRNYNLRME